jgi:tRNA-modifying protein YgfZ
MTVDPRTLPAAVAPAPGWGLLTFDGPDAASFLHGQLSTDVAGMAVGAARWSTYNSPKGRMLATLLLWRQAPDAFAAFVAADLAEALARRLSMFVLRAKVKVADRSGTGRRFGLAGTAAGDAIRAALGEAPPPAHGLALGETVVVATADGRLLLHVPDAQAEDVLRRLSAHATPVSPADLEWVAIATGVPVVTRATQDLFVPQSANLDLVGGVDFNKGCYPGQEIVARMQYLGRQKERLMAFHADAEVPVPATSLYSAAFGEQACGSVVNAAAAPAGGCDLLAVVQWAALESGDLRLGTPQGPVLVRGTLPYAVPAPVAPARPKL